MNAATPLDAGMPDSAPSSDAATPLDLDAARQARADGACQSISRTLVGVDAVSINYGNQSPVAATYTDNLLLAYRRPDPENYPPGTSFDITGWVRFDLAGAGVSPAATVVDLELILYANNMFASPHENPNVVVQYAAAGTWDRSSANPSNLPRTQTLTAGFGAPTVGWMTYPIAATARDWSVDVQAGTLTVGVANVNPAYSYAYFDGVDRSATKAYLILTACD